jgi:hypothetical protein
MHEKLWIRIDISEYRDRILIQRFDLFSHVESKCCLELPIIQSYRRCVFHENTQTVTAIIDVDLEVA